MSYVIRIPANKNLQSEIEDILFRPPGRPSVKALVRYKSLRYQGGELVEASAGCRQSGASPR